MNKLFENLSESLIFLSQGLRLLVAMELRRLPKETMEAFDERLHFSFRILCLVIAHIGCFYHSVIATVEYNLPFLSQFKDFIVISHGVQFLLLSVLCLTFNRLSLRTIRLLITLSFIGGFSHYIYIGSLLILGGKFMVLTAFGFAGIYAISIGLIAVLPFAGIFTNGAFTLFAWSLTIWLVFLAPHPLFGFILTSCAFGITFVLKTLIWILVAHYIELDVKQKEKIIRTERALIERDLELARKIQDSSAPPEVVYWNSAKINCMINKHSAVGGDWVGIHQDQLGSLHIVVADAMGKGLQAALVIHAVQSLWAQAVSGSQFIDPEKWLRALNATLYHMGQKATHFVTMGFLQITETQSTYWSCAHVPLFIRPKDPNAHMRSLLPSGSPIGIHKDPLFVSRKFPTAEIEWLLLGTDGVFAKGSRHSEREILHLKDKLDTHEKDFLKNLPADDDKTLIFVQMQYAAVKNLKKTGS